MVSQQDGAKVIPLSPPGRPQATEPYAFAPAFEKAFLLFFCTKPKVFGNVFKFLDPDALSPGAPRLAARAALQIGAELGHGPSSALAIIQRIRRWQYEGKVAATDLAAVSALFDDGEQDLDEEAVLAEVVPVLRKRIERQSLLDAMGAFSRGDDPMLALKRIEAAQRMGKHDNSIGTVLGPSSFDEIERLKGVQRLRTGILELDDALDGGPMRGTASMFLGKTNGGKSIGLIQVAVSAALQGFHVAYATLELPDPVILSRIKACMTGVPTNAILADPYKSGAVERLAYLQSRPDFGVVVVKTFTPKVSRPFELFSWVKDTEQEWGRQVDVLVVDYADKLSADSVKKGEDSTYHAMGSVYDQLYAFARDNTRWVWSASQASKNKEHASRLIDLDDVSDSMNKVRNFDLVVSLNGREEDAQMIFFVAKNRLGARNAKVGPLPVDFSRSRIAPNQILDEVRDEARLAGVNIT